MSKHDDLAGEARTAADEIRAKARRRKAERSADPKADGPMEYKKHLVGTRIIMTDAPLRDLFLDRGLDPDMLLASKADAARVKAAVELVRAYLEGAMAAEVIHVI